MAGSYRAKIDTEFNKIEEINNHSIVGDFNTPLSMGRTILIEQWVENRKIKELEQCNNITRSD